MEDFQIRALDHVQIAAPVGSEGAMRDFYGGLLGLREREKPEPLRSRGGLWFDYGNMQLHIGIDPVPPVNLSSKRHVALTVADLDSARNRFVEAGCGIEEDTARIDGVTRFYVRDPVGNRLELLQRA